MTDHIRRPEVVAAAAKLSKKHRSWSREKCAYEAKARWCAKRAAESMRERSIDAVALHGGSVEIEAAIRRA